MPIRFARVSSNRDYFLDRAEEEEAKARQADSPAASDAHHRLARLYRATAGNCGPRPLDEHEIGASEFLIL